MMFQIWRGNGVDVGAFDHLTALLSELTSCLLKFGAKQFKAADVSVMTRQWGHLQAPLVTVQWLMHDF